MNPRILHLTALVDKPKYYYCEQSAHSSRVIYYKETMKYKKINLHQIQQLNKSKKWKNVYVCFI